MNRASFAVLVGTLSACGASTAQAPALVHVDVYHGPSEVVDIQKAVDHANGTHTQVVPIGTLDPGHRWQIPLSEAGKRRAREQGVNRLTVVMTVCADEHGVPERVGIVYEPNVTGLDDFFRDQVAARRFEPYLVDGKPVPVCTSVMTRYAF